MAKYPKLRQIHEKVTHKECDVLVVGGGPAGIASSIAAARAGARVFLMERYGFFGGLASSAMVGTICGLYLRESCPEVRYVCNGFMREWAELISRFSNSATKRLNNGLKVLTYDEWAFKRTADNLIRNTDGIEPILHATLASVGLDGKSIKEVRAVVWDREHTFLPSSVVDCTGEATILSLAGVPFEEDTGDQAAAVIFSVESNDGSVFDTNTRLSLLRDIMRAIKNGRLSAACGAVSLVPLKEDARSLYLKVNLQYRPSSGWNRLTDLEFEARDIIDEMGDFLRRESSVRDKVRIARMPHQVGIRGGRRARGKAVLSEHDILNCRKFPDGVACGAWPMELWGMDNRPDMMFMPEGGYYEIPIGCLMPEGLENVFVAGKSISASSKAIASARVIGTSLSTGWAAGKVAAFYSRNRPISQAVKEVREEQVRGIHNEGP